MSGVGSFRTVSTTTANITTDNVGTLNVSGTATITKLSINSTMRNNNNLFNCSTSSTGPYLFIANDATIGTYDTNNSIYPWFVEMDGDAKFNSINLTSGNIQTNNSLNVYSNTIANITSSKTLGLSNITGDVFVFEPYYSNTFTISTPISLYRQYRNTTANVSLFNRIYDTLNSVSYTILKNGSTFATGTCTTNNTLPNTQIYVSSNSSTSSRNYEIYITNATCSFTPTISPTSDTYTVNYTVNYSQDTLWQNYNLIMESFGYYINTDISTISGNPTLLTGSHGLNYSSSNYIKSTSNYSTNTSRLQINSIVSNSIQNQNTIITNDLNVTNNLNVSNLRSNNFLFGQQLTPAYMLDGTKQSGFNWHPITCSQYKLKVADVDDIYVVYPGYKLIVYFNDGYSGQSATINNYTGTTPTYIDSVSLYGSNNAINSCRLYYLNDSTEITNVLIS